MKKIKKLKEKDFAVEVKGNVYIMNSKEAKLIRKINEIIDRLNKKK